MTPLCLIPLSLHKFEVCCVPIEKSHHACWRDAKDEIVAELSDGTTYFIPICDKPEHRRLAEEAKKKLVKGTSIREISNLVMQEQVFIKPTELLDKKCKVIQWENHKKMKQLPEIEFPKPPQPPKPQESASKVYKVSAKWKWIDDIGQWCNLKGDVVAIKKLDDHELKLTLIAVCNANFKKIPADMNWIREIVPPPNETILFPEDALCVKSSRAKEKLDDFRVEARRRGYL
jgi:hypothetical protein